MQIRDLGKPQRRAMLVLRPAAAASAAKINDYMLLLTRDVRNMQRSIGHIRDQVHSATGRFLPRVELRLRDIPYCDGSFDEIAQMYSEDECRVVGVERGGTGHVAALDVVALGLPHMISLEVDESRPHGWHFIGPRCCTVLSIPQHLVQVALEDVMLDVSMFYSTQTFVDHDAPAFSRLVASVASATMRTNKWDSRLGQVYQAAVGVPQYMSIASTIPRNGAWNAECSVLYVQRWKALLASVDAALNGKSVDGIEQVALRELACEAGSLVALDDSMRSGTVAPSGDLGAKRQSRSPVECALEFIVANWPHPLQLSTKSRVVAGQCIETRLH